MAKYKNASFTHTNSTSNHTQGISYDYRPGTIGLCAVERTMKMEYPLLDFNDREPIKTVIFSLPYLEGNFQSGIPEVAGTGKPA